jgi:ATP-binding cassette subfamily B protein
MEQITAKEAAELEEETDRFSLQEYYTPTHRKRLSRFPRLARISFGIVVASARRELIQIVALQALSAAGLAAELLLVKSLLGHLVGHSGIHFTGLLPQLIALSVLTLVLGTSSVVLGLQGRLLAQLVARHAIDKVARAAASVDLITYESPAFHNRLQRAQLAASSRPAMMVRELIGSAGALMSIGAIALTLLLLQPLFCLMVVVAYIPIWFTTNRAGRLGYRQTVEQTERERMRQYLYQLLSTKPAAQEIRAFGIGSFLAERQDMLYERILAEVRAVLRKRVRLALLGQAATALLTAGALAMLVWLVTSGRMSISAAGSAAGAMVLLSGRLHGVAGSSAGLYENSLYLEDYVNFVNSAPAGDSARGAGSAPAADSDRGADSARAASSAHAAARSNGAAPRPPQVLSAERISFTYPSRTRPSLIDASLVLRRGEVVALVGENGSGKTTFAKLLAGLYRPQRGIIAWDGVDIAGLDPVAVRRHVAVIFQDFVHYLLPAHDNVALGDAERFGERAAVERAARQAGIHETLASLPSGYETILGPSYFGGSDLSGGQWQRVALARLFFRDAPIVILDEPTAALDPRAEADLYASMRTLFDGRGVLLISHRFASARTADRIYVLREGRVHEQGSHPELMAAGGYYAELFELQARQYRD